MWKGKDRQDSLNDIQASINDEVVKAFDDLKKRVGELEFKEKYPHLCAVEKDTNTEDMLRRGRFLFHTENHNNYTSGES